MERTSKKDHEYGGKQLKAGDRFEVEDERHLPILLAFGRIEPIEGEQGYGQPQLAQQEAAVAATPAFGTLRVRRRK